MIDLKEYGKLLGDYAKLDNELKEVKQALKREGMTMTEKTIKRRVEILEDNDNISSNSICELRERIRLLETERNMPNPQFTWESIFGLRNRIEKLEAVTGRFLEYSFAMDKNCEDLKPTKKYPDSEAAE